MTMVGQKKGYLSRRAEERQRKKHIIWTIALVVGVGFLGGGALWLSRLDSLRIQTVTVEGVGSSLEKSIKTVVEEELDKNIFFVFPRRNTFLFSKKVLQEKLLAEPKLKTVEIDRFGFSEIKVVVTERAPFALWCDNKATTENVAVVIEHVDTCYFVDNEGYIYAHAPFFSGHVFFELNGGPLFYDRNKVAQEPSEASSSASMTLSMSASRDTSSQDAKLKTNQGIIGTSYIPKKDFLLSMDFINILKDKGIQTRSLFVREKNLFELELVQGGVIRFIPSSDLAKTAEALKVAYDKKFASPSKVTPTSLEYIDARFANKVIFKFK